MLTLLKIPYLRLKYRFLPDSAQAFWGQELLEAQGMGAKLGQLLSQGQKTALPKASLTISEAKALFTKNFEQSVHIQSEAIAASMGQVFRGLIDQEQMAIKILHPGIRQKLQKEIQNILLLGKYFSKSRGFSFDRNVFERFLMEVFNEETDLFRESRFQNMFRNFLIDDPRFRIPTVIEKFSNDHILTQEWVHSTLARDVDVVPNNDVFHFFFKTLLSDNILHGDLNDRNWGFEQSQKVVVYDFGCAQVVSDRRVNGLKKLILNQDVVTAFKEFGVRLEATWFKGQEQELRDALFNPLFKSVIAPDWAYKTELEAKFGEKVKLLREFTDPWVLLMMRSLFSLIRFYQSRGIPVQLMHAVSPYLKMTGTEQTSVRISVEVSTLDLQRFFIQLPFESLPDLGLHIPAKIRDSIDVEGVINLALKKGAVAQELFNVTLENDKYRVWID